MIKNMLLPLKPCQVRPAPRLRSSRLATWIPRRNITIRRIETTRPVDRDSIQQDILPRLHQRFKSQVQNASQSMFKMSDEVAHAITNGTPVVALETTIYTHGFPYPDNLSLAFDLEKIVRANSAVPATIGIVGGVARVGLTEKEIEILASAAGKPETMKVSRRDIPYILGMGLAGRKIHGGTTISGTMYLARKAGINVFGTGGLGGVHRGGQDTMDVSADLTELGRTSVAVISSGCKSFLDIPRTLEYLETQGVPVCTFADGRIGDIDLPSFYTRASGIRSPMVVQSPREAAAMIYAQFVLGIKSASGMLFANPIPEEFSMSKEVIDAAINQAVQEAAEQGIHGHANTPFILARIKDLTQGSSIPANRALIESNVAMASQVAVELSKFRKTMDRGNYQTESPRFMPALVHSPESAGDMVSSRPSKKEPHLQQKSLPGPVDVVVYGSVAIDLSCDYAPLSEKSVSPSENISPHLHTSNIASITPSIGGVGHNVALAAHLVGGSVRLHSLVADDLAGKTILSALHDEGLDTSGIKVCPVEHSLTKGRMQSRTAQYVAVNDTKKDLVLAMADMSIFSIHGPKAPDSQKRPKWSVIDANWHRATIHLVTSSIKKLTRAKIAYEPVSVPKSGAIFEPYVKQKNQLESSAHSPKVFPANSIDLATPNQHELATMHETAKRHEYFESDPWWRVIDAFGIPGSGARDRFIQLTNAALTDAGIPLQSIQLLPYIPTILTKLGSEGVLMTELLKSDDPRLTDPDSAPYILSRCSNGTTEIGGIYMRLFPAVEVVEDPISVNGVGDTFLGVLVAGLAKGIKLDERLIDVAQRAAVMTLRSKEAVAPGLVFLTEEFKALAGGKEFKPPGEDGW